MQNPFEQVATRYGLTTPTQVKQRIMWENLKAVISHLYGVSPQNEVLMQRYETEFRAAEKEENEGT